MNREAELDELPESYAVALRLLDAGHDNTATATGIELESVEPLLRLADKKLALLLQED